MILKNVNNRQHPERSDSVIIFNATKDKAVFNAYGTCAGSDWDSQDGITYSKSEWPYWVYVQEFIEAASMMDDGFFSRGEPTLN